ncbi:MAG: ankyrin repeat domain-containing protein [Acidobacteria bacterium]|nr:ankyrin repeat domain-containing protein [Acidobacteriota bacterium]
MNDLIAPIDHTLADTQVDVAFGITTLPHLKDLALAGPQHAVKYPIEERGTSPNARDADGHTAQHHAASRGDDEMIKYLVSKGADVTMLNRGGQTTVDMANGPVLRVQPFPETIKLLESLARRTTASAFPVGRQAR